ncbi:UNVERIFIED_CONTAM: hypothetical protein FKN15_034727 [Acipenser sinensis]
MLLDCLGLSQSVNVPTHTRGHTLDLLITKGLDISNLSISDISLPDHFFITVNINLPALSSATDTVISFHPKNLLNPLKLSECVSASPLTGTLPSSVDDAVTLYNTTLTHIMDTVALLTARTVKKDQNCPWYTLELRVLKSACRKLERKWRSSGLKVHREIWTDHLMSYRHALAVARVKYFSEIITMRHGCPFTRRQNDLKVPQANDTTSKLTATTPTLTRERRVVLRSVCRQQTAFFTLQTHHAATQSYSVGGQRSSGQLTGKLSGARPDYRDRWCVVSREHPGRPRPPSPRAVLGQFCAAPWELPSQVGKGIA